MKTTWLLDVDGVINVNDPGWPIPGKFNSAGKQVREAPKAGMAYAAGYAFKMRWSPSLLARLKKLIHSDLVDVVWSTSWVGYTASLEKLWGLPTLPTAWTAPPEGNYVGDLKINAALEVIDSGDRLIWTDDMEVPTHGAHYDHLTKDGNALLIRPNERTGLRPEHLDAIEQFISPTKEPDSS